MVVPDAEFRPIATSPALLATAFGPTATELVPSAWESGKVELAWKYLMPPPTLMLLSVVPMASTAWLVAKSCEPLIASVDVADPARRQIGERALRTGRADADRQVGLVPWKA